MEIESNVCDFFFDYIEITESLPAICALYDIDTHFAYKAIKNHCGPKSDTDNLSYLARSIAFNIL